MIVGGLVIYPALYSIYLATLNKAQTKFVGLGNFTFLFIARDVLDGGAAVGDLRAHRRCSSKRCSASSPRTSSTTCRPRASANGAACCWCRGSSRCALSTLGWWWMFDPTHSALQLAPQGLGFAEFAWLSDPYWARFSVILDNVWYGAPFFLIMYLAALKSVPEQLYEAASIDGANAWQKLIHITLPMMRNIIAITVLFSLIVTFANFDIVQIMTRAARAT